MELDDCDGSPSVQLWPLTKVIGKSLDPGKHWFVLTKSICGIKPNKFAQNEIFRRFPDEIRSVPPADLKPAVQGCSFSMRQKNLLVASSFGLCAGLLRQREIDPKGFVASPKFIPVVDAINGIALDDCAPCNLGGKSLQANPDLEMQKLQSRIIELEAEIKKMEDSVLVSSPPLAASTPCCSSNESETSTNSISSSDSSVIEETLQSSLGPTRKKRKVAHECRKISEEIDGVLGKYHESLGCILGNSLLYGGDEQKVKVSETISKVVDLVMDATGSKQALAELLVPETYQRFLESMRVPDWVLLYFKLQAKLPDAAWQTLLNLTQLGRSGVSGTLNM